MYKQQAIQMKIIKILSSIFDKIKSFFSWGQLQEQAPSLLLVLYEVRPETIFSFFQEEMINHIALMQRAGFLIKVEVLTEQIPDEYIGRLSVWCEGILESPRHWLLPQGYFDRIQFVSR